MSESTSKEISSADESASTVSEDNLDKSFDKQSEEGSVSSNNKQSTDDSSLESDLSENEITDNDSFCRDCNKQFANKPSLASHKSRFHRKSDGDNNKSSASKEKVDGSINQQSEEGSQTYSDNDTQSTVVSTSASDTDQNNDSDHNSDNSITRQGYSLKRKQRRNVVKLTRLLDSMKQVLQSKSCIEKEDCFDLLSSYRLKKEIFAELGGIIKLEHGVDIDEVLSEDERGFVDALLSTTSLIELTKLMNENTRIVKSILEQHVVTKRRKHL